jgi:hypothetical protein
MPQRHTGEGIVMLTDTSENLHYSTQPYDNIKSNILQATQESLVFCINCLHLHTSTQIAQQGDAMAQQL